jgi:hypothetical protein
VDIHAADLVGINGITRVLLVHLSAGCVPSRQRTTSSTPAPALCCIFIVVHICAGEFLLLHTKAYKFSELFLDKSRLS